MRSFVVLSAATLTLWGGAAHAQTAAPAATSDRGYVEAVAQSAFGNVTSQSFGGEAGFTLVRQLQVFIEVGKTRDVATTAIGTGAQKIASALADTQNNVGFSVKEPVTFGVAGLRYSLVPPGASKIRPYVMAGAGVANVTQDVKFTVGGSDVTSTIQQYGIVLGSDLSGDFTKAIIVFGGGVMYPAWKQLVLDFQFRLGRILAEDEGITVGRAGLGVGIRF
jgi:hypothetical protein